ncbi:MAG: Gfo/Idh/MocA family oxidoreductase [Candidatus Poribacteria bacterium]|nr:Gfo/Idh/MocA family oxidoreductase [Candidatus Poribacteria bacterium]
MAKYRAGVIGLGWMGMLSDLARRIWDAYNVDDVVRPTPELDVHRKFHFHEHHSKGDVPHSWAEVMWDRPEIDLIAGADRDPKRLMAFGERYGEVALYTDAPKMLRAEKLDIVAIATNTKGRADLTGLAVACGVKGIATEKPMAHTLEEADRMVKACADAGVPLCCGAIPVNHPAYAKAKELVTSGAIGEVISIEAEAPMAQKQHWSYFVDSPPAWVIGAGDGERRQSGSDEFTGQGLMVTVDGLFVHFRKGAGLVRLTGTLGEIQLHQGHPAGWQLWQDISTPDGSRRVEMPWPAPQFVGGYNAVYGLADIIDCLEGRLSEPKNSGRRVAVALGVEIALKQSSAQGGVRVDLPLKDRSLGLRYDWFR